MVFSSITFVFIFLPVFLLVYYIFPNRLRNIVILSFSIFFYFWGEQELVSILLLSALINYGCGKLIHEDRRKVGLLLCLLCNLGVLFYFKYYNFTIDTGNDLLAALGVGEIRFLNKQIALPIGVSFFTFQGISYVLDIYFGRIEPSKSLVNFSTYLCMFPQLIAGPIVRFSDIQQQLKSRVVSLNQISIGCERFIIGLFKKVMLADTFSRYADPIFNQDFGTLDFISAWVGIVAFSFQIYFDFSGYSDMAIGMCLMLGFTLPENFNYPYISTSIREFWRRWHISLSTWFRDYLYIPLGGNRKGSIRTYFNLFIVFVTTGIWHGASWNYVIWGLIHGLFIIVERIGFDRILKKMYKPFNFLYTILIVLISWVFFRINTFDQAIEYLARLFTIQSMETLKYSVLKHFNIEFTIVFIIAMVLSTPIYKLLREKYSGNSFQLIWYPSLVCFFIISLINLTVSTFNPFIYFRF